MAAERLLGTRSLFVVVTVLCLLPGTLSAALSRSTFCEGLALTGNCSFYSLCMEKRVPCGPNGYALGYAAKYCIKFSENADEFDKDVRRDCYTMHAVLTGRCMSIRIHTLALVTGKQKRPHKLCKPGTRTWLRAYVAGPCFYPIHVHTPL